MFLTATVLRSSGSRAFFTVSAIALGFVLSSCGGRSSGAPPTQISGNRQSFSAPLEANAGAPAGTYRIVHNFGAAGDGADPSAALIATAGGTLYGTTLGGGTLGFGTVFRLTSTGTERVLHSFGAAGDGENSYGLFNDRGTFYGTTEHTNAATNCGTVFTISAGGTEHIVHTFGNTPDGCNPVAPLAINYDGNLVGTTEHGGNAAGDGTSFIIISGALKVQHAFKGTDGASPQAPLKSLYSFVWGTTASGGSKNRGIIFAENADTGAIINEHSFGGGTDGWQPSGGLLLLQDVLYGPAQMGGLHGDGIIFSKSQANGVYKDLYDFKGSPDGAKPVGALVDVNGTFYGVTSGGGTSGLGTVFKITPTGTETVLHSFSGGTTDGSTPESGLVLSGTLLYGTTSLGGTSNNGTVFAISP